MTAEVPMKIHLVHDFSGFTSPSGSNTQVLELVRLAGTGFVLQLLLYASLLHNRFNIWAACGAHECLTQLPHGRGGWETTAGKTTARLL